MKLFGLLPYIAAAIIIIFNKQILDYAEKKSKENGKSFNRQKAFVLTIISIIVLILKGLYFSKN